jgi:hypothetical protein
VPTLAEAQAEARASGRLILVTTTKPDCGICDKFMHEIAPACGTRLNQVAVSYVYDIMRPESARLDHALRNNLPGAILMPLVGFFTADLAWVHGFGGPRTAQEFMGDIETASRMQPRRNAALRSVSGPATAMVSFVNEYGETEWSEPANVWPKPVDALGAQPTLAQVPAAGVPAGAMPPPTPSAAVTGSDPVASNPVASDPVAAASPEPQPAIGPEVAVVPGTVGVDPQGWSPPAPAPEPGMPEPAIAQPVIVADAELPTVTPAPDPVPQPAPPPPVLASESNLPAPLPPIAAPDPSAIAPVAMDEAQARASLAQAFDLIRRGHYDRARDELRRVSRSLPNTQVGREADRGGAAIYNARQIAEASATERTALAARARRSLSGTMWEPLF